MGKGVGAIRAATPVISPAAQRMYTALFLRVISAASAAFSSSSAASASVLNIDEQVIARR